MAASVVSDAVRPEKTLAQLGVGYPDFAGLATELEDEFGVVLDVDELEKAAGVRGWDELARKLRSVFAGTARGPLPAEPPANAAADAPRGKVLVVEDVMLIRMATVDMIEQLGFQALEAGDGAEALALLQKNPDIETLLTDLGLPGMNGRQLVEEARRLRPDLKVIVASGYSTESQAGGRPDGDIAHLTKPFDLGQLRRALGA